MAPDHELNISIEIIDDKVFEEIEQFEVVLELPTLCDHQLEYAHVFIYASDGINNFIMTIIIPANNY